jgi:hypothetical protein
VPLLNLFNPETRPTSGRRDRPHINSLWIGGPLSTMERLCMLSHLRQGHAYHLWVYDETDAPDGVTLEDANAICDRREIFSYQVGQGAGSVSAFSNLFRYRLLLRRGGWWCDTDVVALRPFTFEDEFVFASQVDRDGSSSTTSCVFKVPPASAVMHACHERAMAVDRSTVRWGVMGPRLLDEMVSACGLERFVAPPATFCPTNWFDAEIDPAAHEWSIGEDSYAVHLWHEMWRRNNVDKNGVYPGTLYEWLKAPYARALEARPALRRWLDGLRGRAKQPRPALPRSPRRPVITTRRPVVKTPGTLIADWPDTRLEAAAEQYAYGTDRTPLLARAPDGPLVFTPRTAEDHIAIPFVPLEPAKHARTLSLVVEGPPVGAAGCAADLQDQNYNVLASVRGPADGEQQKTVGVSADVHRIRVVFQAARPGRIVLPRRVRVLEHAE